MRNTRWPGSQQADPQSDIPRLVGTVATAAGTRSSWLLGVALASRPRTVRRGAGGTRTRCTQVSQIFCGVSQLGQLVLKHRFFPHLRGELHLELCFLADRRGCLDLGLECSLLALCCCCCLASSPAHRCGLQQLQRLLHAFPACNLSASRCALFFRLPDTDLCCLHLAWRRRYCCRRRATWASAALPQAASISLAPLGALAWAAAPT